MKKIALPLVLGVCLGAIACGTTSTTTNTSVTPSNATPAVSASPAATQEIAEAEGLTLYKQNCAACHKEDGTGGKVTIEGTSLDVEDLTADKIKKFTDEKLTRYITNGVEDEGMPAFKDKLSESQIREVVDYIRGNFHKMGKAEGSSPAS